ncbi:MAG: Diphthamide biosynthesis protein 2 [Caeruleum heppii]|nr:MAG: Diphthamide biosynthesis protein 2 [Caeruleum heppii]
MAPATPPLDAKPGVAPALSTPDTRILDETAPPVPIKAWHSEDQVRTIYEIDRTIREIRQGNWTRIALQLPDEMLVDAPRIYQLLARGLSHHHNPSSRGFAHGEESSHSTSPPGAGMSDQLDGLALHGTDKEDPSPDAKLFILGDTSYGSCCVDEIAAEHADAEVVVHYGRSCLSPTARLPIIYVFTSQPLPISNVIQCFKDTYLDRDASIVLTADVTYASHISTVHSRLVAERYTHLYSTSIVHDPTADLPNRKILRNSAAEVVDLQNAHVFHISEPPQSLLLTLSSRVASINIYPTAIAPPTSTPSSLPASTHAALRRRYALLTSLSTVSVFGILINTLSVKNYLHIVELVKKQISDAGKKSYTFVVGKINAAKIANFSEIGGWVVIGCWESSLVENKEFWKPVITPFELGLALQQDGERVWTGSWTSDFNKILEDSKAKSDPDTITNGTSDRPSADEAITKGADYRLEGDLDSEPESAPPEFDLRTGRYVSHSRPMRGPTRTAQVNGTPPRSDNLTKRVPADLTTVGGVASPGADFLRTQRTWRGLGSDMEISYEEDGSSASREGARVEEGRNGMARGYTSQKDGQVH